MPAATCPRQPAGDRGGYQRRRRWLPGQRDGACDQPNRPTATGWAHATDNCDPEFEVTYADSVAPGSCPQARVITRRWTATDDCQNSSTCVQTITVVDTIPPLVLCRPTGPSSATSRWTSASPSCRTTATRTPPSRVRRARRGRCPQGMGRRPDLESHRRLRQCRGLHPTR